MYSYYLGYLYEQSPWLPVCTVTLVTCMYCFFQEYSLKVMDTLVTNTYTVMVTLVTNTYTVMVTLVTNTYTVMVTLVTNTYTV